VKQNIGLSVFWDELIVAETPPKKSDLENNLANDTQNTKKKFSV